MQEEQLTALLHRLNENGQLKDLTLSSNDLSEVKSYHWNQIQDAICIDIIFACVSVALQRRDCADLGESQSVGHSCVQTTGEGKSL